MWCLWSAKGGVGCTVTAAALALQMAATERVLLVDLAGDLELMLGRRGNVAGLAQWLARPDAPPDALSRLEVDVTPKLALLPRGSVPTSLVAAAMPTGVSRLHEGPELLARMLGLEHRRVIVDVGLRGGDGPSAEAVEQLLRLCSRSTLVTRACPLALTAARRAGWADEIILIGDRGRALGAKDVEATLGAPVVAQLRRDPAVARSVAAGTLAARPPRSLRALRHLMAEVRS